MSFLSKFFSPAKANTVVVAHGSDKYDVEFDEGAIEGGAASVGELRESCVGITSCPAGRIKLLYRGKILADDSVKLKAVGIQAGSKVLCLASKETPSAAASSSTAAAVSQDTPAARAARKKQEEQERLRTDPLGALGALVDDIRSSLEPSVRNFVSGFSSAPTASGVATAANTSDLAKRQEQHDRLAELLLQKLFLLDGITSREGADDAERDELRQKRRDGVKYTQGLLDEVDAAMRDAKVQADLTEGTSG